MRQFGSVTILLTVFVFTPLDAQESIFNEQLLPAVRDAAGMIPGAPPTAVNVLRVARFPVQLSYMIDGEGDELVDGVHSVFQIRYPDGWIMVDAAGDEETLGGTPFSADAFQQCVDALLGARLIIATHEHADHVLGLIHSPHAERFAEKTILTKEQVHSLVTAPHRPEIGLTEEQAARYLTMSYEKILPLAPGVVLIKAAGHKPGNQMVYIRLHSGREIILAGDIAWQMMGIDRGLQKPESSSEIVGENRAPIPDQLRWLREVKDMGIAVVVFHDLAATEEQVAQGILGNGIEFDSP
jgi:glyoxylase-like metal-dependent hydrolase (beta-lactamase superfamily II)